MSKMKKIKDFKQYEVKETSKIKGGNATGKGDKPSVVGFGSFSISERAAKTGR